VRKKEANFSTQIKEKQKHRGCVVDNNYFTVLVWL